MNLMTITLQDLAVLSEKATQGEYVACAGTGGFGSIEAWTPAYLGCRGQGSYMLGVQCVGNEPNADFKFIAALVNFYRSGELQRLAELAEDGERWREYLSHHAVEQRAEVIAAIDSARAPSGKGGE
jgi:hypothetical protein